MLDPVYFIPISVVFLLYSRTEGPPGFSRDHKTENTAKPWQYDGVQTDISRPCLLMDIRCSNRLSRTRSSNGPGGIYSNLSWTAGQGYLGI